MRTTKLLLVMIAASLLFTSTVFGQTKTTIQNNDQIKKKQIEESKKKEELKQKSKIKKTSNVKDLKPKPKPVKKRKSTIPEVELKNSRITYEYTTFDFGLVPSGSKVTHNFPVTNTGVDTLIITKVKPT